VSRPVELLVSPLFVSLKRSMPQGCMRVIEHMGRLGQRGSICIVGICAKTAIKLMHLNFISLQATTCACNILASYCTFIALRLRQAAMTACSTHTECFWVAAHDAAAIHIGAATQITCNAWRITIDMTALSCLNEPFACTDRVNRFPQSRD